MSKLNLYFIWYISQRKYIRLHFICGLCIAVYLYLANRCSTWYIDSTVLRMMLWLPPIARTSKASFGSPLVATSSSVYDYYAQGNLAHNEWILYYIRIHIIMYPHKFQGFHQSRSHYYTTRIHFTSHTQPPSHTHSLNFHISNNSAYLYKLCKYTGYLFLKHSSQCIPLSFVGIK